jgi:hypothetical protein
MKKLVWLLLLALPAMAQNPVVPFRTPRATFLTSTGQPLSGGCIFTYQGGTTTPQATYTDYTGGTSNPNPVPLDTTGSAVMWLGTNSYKFVGYSAGGTNCASGSLQWTVDNVPGDAFLNGTISGATITNPAIGGGTQTGTVISGVTIATSDIESTPIGGTTPAAGSFTSLASAFGSVAFSATPVFNASAYGYFSMSLTGNVTSSTITGGQTGQRIVFSICANGYAFAWPANLSAAPGFFLPNVNEISGYCTILAAYNNGSNWVMETNNQQIVAGLLDALAFSATPVFNAGSYSDFTITLTGNVASSTLTGGQAGQVIFIDVCQNGTGGYTFAWPTTLLNPPAISPEANSCTGVVAFSAAPYWITVAISNPAAPGVGPNPSVPSITVGAANGTGGTIAVNGYSNDFAGTVNIAVGTSPASGTLFTLNFGGNYSSHQIYCLFGVTQGSTAWVSGQQWGINGTANVVFTVPSALTASTTYELTYLCHQ